VLLVISCHKPDDTPKPDTPRYTANMKGVRTWQGVQKYQCHTCIPVVESVPANKTGTFEIEVENDTTIYDGSVPAAIRTLSDKMQLIATDVQNETVVFENNGQGKYMKVAFYNKTNKIVYTCIWETTRDKLEMVWTSQ